VSRAVSFVVCSLVLAAAASASGERFTVRLVLTFAAIMAIIYAVTFVTVRVLDRIGRS
jgi:hypothetical protein